MFLTPLMLLFFASPSSFAILNVESLRLEPQENEVKSVVAATAKRAEGNSNTEEITSAVQVRRLTESNEQIVLAKTKFGESQGIKSANNHSLHLRYTAIVNQRWRHEYFLQTEGNEFTRLKYRNLIGAGLRWSHLQTEKFALNFGLGVFHSQEELEANAGLIELKESTERSNIYLSFLLTIATKVKFISVTYFQPKIKYLSDYHMHNDSEFLFSITKNFSVSINYSQKHDNVPPPAIKKTDHEYSTVLKFTY